MSFGSSASLESLATRFARSESLRDTSSWTRVFMSSSAACWVPRHSIGKRSRVDSTETSRMRLGVPSRASPGERRPTNAAEAGSRNGAHAGVDAGAVAHASSPPAAAARAAASAGGMRQTARIAMRSPARQRTHAVAVPATSAERRSARGSVGNRAPAAKKSIWRSKLFAMTVATSSSHSRTPPSTSATPPSAVRPQGTAVGRGST